MSIFLCCINRWCFTCICLVRALARWVCIWSQSPQSPYSLTSPGIRATTGSDKKYPFSPKRTSKSCLRARWVKREGEISASMTSLSHQAVSLIMISRQIFQTLHPMVSFYSVSWLFVLSYFVLCYLRTSCSLLLRLLKWHGPWTVNLLGPYQLKVEMHLNSFW